MGPTCIFPSWLAGFNLQPRYSTRDAVAWWTLAHPQAAKGGGRMRLTGALGLALLSFGCAGSVKEVTPIPPQGASRQYQVSTVYGGLDGTREGAERILAREARDACGGTFDVLGQDTAALRTMWGAKNGQRELFWQVRCQA